MEGAEGREEGTEEVREQDRYLPIANISRIMKKSLPSNAKIAKDAKGESESSLPSYSVDSYVHGADSAPCS